MPTLLFGENDENYYECSNWGNRTRIFKRGICSVRSWLGFKAPTADLCHGEALCL